MTDLKNYCHFERVKQHEWVRAFWCAPHSGFSFPVDPDGTYHPRNPDSDRNYADCLSGKYPDCKDQGVIEEVWYSSVPAHGDCPHCGQQVWLNDPLWNECDCGHWFNLSGQEVNPPHSGPYETGEMWSDIYLGRDADY